jgi:hypothetical protein
MSNYSNISTTPEYQTLKKFLSPGVINWLLLATADLETGGTYRSDLISPTGAEGLFQFLPSTQKAFSAKYGLPSYSSGDLITQARYALAHFKEGLDWIRGHGFPAWIQEYNLLHPATNKANLIRAIRYHYHTGPRQRPKPKHDAEITKAMVIWDKKINRGTKSYPPLAKSAVNVMSSVPDYASPRQYGQSYEQGRPGAQLSSTATAGRGGARFNNFATAGRGDVENASVLRMVLGNS